MAGHKGDFISRTIRTLIVLIPSLVSLFSNITTLVSIEARLAGKSILSIVVLSLFLASLLTTMWICILALAFVYLVSLHISIMISLTILLLSNLILFCIIVLIIARKRNKLLFPMTRQQLRSISRICKNF